MIALLIALLLIDNIDPEDAKNIDDEILERKRREAAALAQPGQQSSGGTAIALFLLTLLLIPIVLASIKLLMG